MLISDTAGSNGRWHRAQVLLRLAGLAAVYYGLLVLPPGVGLSGVGLAVTISAGLASVGWLVMIAPPRHHPAVLIAVLAVQVISGAVLAGITQSGPGVVLPAVGVFDAVVLLTPTAAVAVTVAGVFALTLAALAVGGPALPAVAGYTFALAAALLLGFNRRQYMDRVEQADLMLVQAERARREQARAAALEERTRIAREIHDVLAHSLGALAVQLDVTEALLDEGADTDQVRTHVARARRLAVDGLTEARRAVAALREDTPPLPVLLDGLVAQYRADCGAPARLQVTGTPRALPPDAALAAFRTAQEAISNTRKHAPDATVTLDLAYQDDAATLTITDTPAAPAAMPAPLAGTGGGYGLTGLQERAELLGGTLRAGPDGAAWTVRLRLPVPP
ncbi:MAG TPA: histidine kinase [Nakamurella sp.]|jgi:signal transduction histidine kinase